MIKWLFLTEEQRLNTLNIVSENRKGLPLAAIEKDWWITLVLKAVFNSEYSKYLVFKGGTSLSKAWGLIDRFSEDIDLVIDREILGFEGGEYSKSRVKRLKRAACLFTSNELMESIKNKLLEMGVPQYQFSIEAGRVQDPDKDPQQLYLYYKSIVEKDEYLISQVIIEVSARSLSEPAEKRMIRSMVDEQFIKQPFVGAPFEVLATTPAKTFIEKVLLLHEEFQKEPTKVRSYRMTRHLHDIEKIMDTEHGIVALENKELYITIVKHRKVFNLQNFVDHNSYGREQLEFIPPVNLIEQWEEDYKQMQTSMFIGETLPFKKLLKRLEELKERFKVS